MIRHSIQYAMQRIMRHHASCASKKSALRGAIFDATGTEAVIRLGLLTAALGVVIATTPQANAQRRGPAETKASPTKPALKTGVFKNGMRYYIQANPFPAKRAAMWLAVNAGSIQEDDDQLGYAHFMEHMAFNGTRKFPGNKLIDAIELTGMSFGADLNAYTSFDETVYQLTVPTDDQALIRNGLDILQEWASGAILLDSAEVVKERGVVLGEWRQRLMDTMQARLGRDLFSRSFGGENKYMHRFPIGTPESIERATVEPLQRFYRDWYRPDLMAVIVVGDIDPERMYQEVQRRFGSIPPAAKPRPFTRPAVTPEARTAVHVVKDYHRPMVTVRWPNPIRGETPEERVTQELTYTLLLNHLNEMFTRLGSAERRPFVFAGMRVAPGMVRPLTRQLELIIAMHPDSVRTSLAYVLGEIERVAQEGIPAQDLALAKSLEERRLVQAADGSEHIPSRTFAQRYVAHYFGSGDLLLTPAQRHAIGTRVLANLSNEDIRKAAAFWKETAERSVSVDIPLFASVRPPTEAEVRALFDETLAQQHIQTHARPSAVVAQEGKRNALAMASGGPRAPSTVGTTAGARALGADAIVSETVDEASGVVVWTLRNGARVVFKQTANNPDEVIVHAVSPGGYSKLPDSLRLSTGRMIADLMTASGNTEPGDHVHFVQRMSTLGVRQFAVILGGLREEMLVSGSSRNPEVLFSTMHKQFVDPYIDSTAFEEWKRAGGRTVTYSREDQFLYSLTGDRRLGPPPIAGMQLMNLEKGMAVYKDRFGDASDFTFYVVGAITNDSVKAFAARYLAPLPSTNRQTRESLITTKVKSFKGHVASTTEHSRYKAVQASAALTFSGYFPQRYDSVLVEEQRLQAVTRVLSRRLRNKLREEMSVTYGAGASPTIIPVPDWYYAVGIQFMASPEDVNRSVDSTWQVIRTLQREGPTSEELAMTAKIHQRRQENARQSNGWWVMELYRYDFMGAPFSMLADAAPEPIDADAFKATMRRFLSEKSYSQNIIVPTKSAIEKAKEEKAKNVNGAGARNDQVMKHSAR